MIAENPLEDIVSHQYEQWVYPQPIHDLPDWLRSNWQWMDPIHAHAMFWPDREYWSGIDILVAGCGTNQAAIIAYTNPDAHITAIDVSQASLNHHLDLKKKHNLDNLDLHRLPIENVSSLQRDFDLIISTGVLHHLADPQKGLDALAQCLRQDGVIALMLYAHYGRIGLEMMQSVFRDLRFKQDERSIQMVRAALAILPQEHPIWNYIKLAPDLQFDAGLVDTFLHGREKSYTITECIEFAEASHLVFQDIFIKSPYYAHADGKNPFFSAIAALPDREQWSMVERINVRNACHFFTACRVDRNVDTYKIDFKSSKAFDYKPCFRFKCGVSDTEIISPKLNTPLNPQQMQFVRYMDGTRTIQDIVTLVMNDHPQITSDISEWRAYGLGLFRTLWTLDFVAMKI